MKRPPSSFLRGVLLFAAGALVSGAIAVAATNGTKDVWQTGRSGGTPIFGNRPTGVGLPRIGTVTATTGAGDYVPPLKTYHDSGAYAHDLATVDGQASAFLTQRLSRLAAQKRNCLRHRPASKCKQPKPALVLDIDETSLSNYTQLEANDFKNATPALATAAIAANSPAIAPTLRLFNLAKRKHVAIFFITGRPSFLESATESNLQSAGYSGWKELVTNPGGTTVVAYKSGARARIERQGYRVIVNVGDQESDLLGGHALRAFKLPNPFYFTP